MNEVGSMRKSWWRCRHAYVVLCMYAGTFLVWLGFSAALWQYAHFAVHIQQTVAVTTTTIGRGRVDRLFLEWTSLWPLALQAGVGFYVIATVLYNGADNARRWKETVAALRRMAVRVRDVFRKGKPGVE